MELMTRRAAVVGVGLALLAFWLACTVGLGADDGEPDVGDSAWDAALGGRFSVASEAGGAVWSFQPGGGLFVLGPGDLIAEGTWSPGPLPGEVDAVVVVPVTEQVLSVLGSLSPDGSRLAIYVTASEAATPLGGIPWPPASRLVGEQVGLVADLSPSATPPPDACRRPAWGPGDTVDWDRCAEEHDSTSEPAVSPRPVASDSLTPPTASVLPSPKPAASH
jgi:hypothetical protein